MPPGHDRRPVGQRAGSRLPDHSRAELNPPPRDQAIRKLLELPDEIGLVSLRTLGPLMARHRRRHRLNALGTEALAAAAHLGAGVFLSVPSPRLEDALRAEGLHVEVVG